MIVRYEFCLRFKGGLSVKRGNQLLLGLSRVNHLHFHSHAVFELTPKLATTVTSSYSFLAEHFVFAVNLIIHSLLAFLYAENEVVLDNDRSTESTSTDLVFVNANDGIVAWETELLVCANVAYFVVWNVQKILL
jgi:hypothetical protein